MRLIILVLFLGLSACSMSNKEIIAAVKECTDAKMDMRILINGLNNRTLSIECTPKGEE